MAITPRQQELLDFISRYIATNGYAPKIAEIQKHFGWKSTSTAHVLLTALEREGKISRIPNAGRGIEIIENDRPSTDYEVPLLGTVAAGNPIEAILSHETVLLPKDMISRNRSFALKVRGDSMINDGILDGDIIIVESRQTAETGETVVALIDGNDATVKRFYPEPSQIRLEAGNPKYKPIIVSPAKRVAVQGVVKAVIRKYM
ncbi:MAG TPA: transcriptional repressor LexA [Blastocatellia bacterium]|nr:transcriptional repressor LexA [Blastocatellia bacterium]